MKSLKQTYKQNLEHQGDSAPFNMWNFSQLQVVAQKGHCHSSFEGPVQSAD